jgi:hypothetical protein
VEDKGIELYVEFSRGSRSANLHCRRAGRAGTDVKNDNTAAFGVFLNRTHLDAFTSQAERSNRGGRAVINLATNVAHAVRREEKGPRA